MKVLITTEANESKAPFSARDYHRMRRFGQSASSNVYDLTEDPGDADLIVFVGSSEPNFTDIRLSDTFKKNSNKSVVLIGGDRVVPRLPGLYVSLENSWDLRRLNSISSAPYLRVTDNQSMDIEAPLEDAKYLFSFVGSSANNRIRRKICDITHPRAFIRDSSGDRRQQDDGVKGANADRGMEYRDVIAASKFVLCPKGKSVSSWRLFETMRAGRVPVVVSDHWVPPPGPDWKSFTVFMPEKSVSKIPELIESMESQAVNMGNKARQEWEKWYAEDVIFNNLVSQLGQLQKQRNSERMYLRALVYLQYLRPYFLRHWVLSPLIRKLTGKDSLQKSR